MKLLRCAFWALVWLLALQNTNIEFHLWMNCKFHPRNEYSPYIYDHDIFLILLFTLICFMFFCPRLMLLIMFLFVEHEKTSHSNSLANSVWALSYAARWGNFVGTFVSLRDANITTKLQQKGKNLHRVIYLIPKKKHLKFYTIKDKHCSIILTFR